jgi:hypothetical protein
MNEPAHGLNWEQVESVMAHALGLPEDQRNEYLEGQPQPIRVEVKWAQFLRRGRRYLRQVTARR